MGLRINTNVQSMIAQRNLDNVRTEQDSALQRLASGERINKASDDTAGLAISEKLKANIRGNAQAKRNAGDGISMVQTAEGGLNEVANILIRLRELSMQSASDTVGEKERLFTDLEFQQLVKEMERITTSTKFNDRNLLNGTGDTLDFQVGLLNDEFNDRISYSPQDTDATTATLGIEGMDVQSKESAQSNLEAIDTAINTLNANRANLGALQNRLASTISNLEVMNENLNAANSRIRDADIAQESARLAQSNILSASSVSVLTQANNTFNNAIKLVS